MKAYIVDIDGTIFDPAHRLHLIDRAREGGPDWPAFFAACADDSPIWPVIRVVACLAAAGHNIIYVTGRSISTMEATGKCLRVVGLPGSPIVFRSEGDHRPDTIVKKERLEQIMRSHAETDEGFQVLGVFEDRPSVCKVWREMGLPVFQVGSGEDF